MLQRTQNVIETAAKIRITSSKEVEKVTAISRANSDGTRVRMVQRKRPDPVMAGGSARKKVLCADWVEGLL